MNKKSSCFIKSNILALAITMAFSQIAIAGDTTGGISGIVDSGTKTEITIKSKDTGLTRTISTDSSGRFLVPQLPVGNYEVTTTDSAGKTYSQSVDVSIGVTSNILIGANTMDSVQVKGSELGALIDVYSTDTGLQISEKEIDKLPVRRNVNAVALLAPGVIPGDAGFGELPSFGGASVAENIFYLNGLNITNPRNGLGGSEVPFEFFKDFQIKTGGYSAEFGRSTGGVINSVSKTGTNEWQSTFSIIYNPNALASNSKDVYNSEGDLVVSNRYDEINQSELNIQVGGPIIKDKLFIYVLLNPQWTDSTNYQADWTQTKSTNDAMFWGTSINWLINDKNRVDFTAFSDQATIKNKISDWDPYENEIYSAARPSENDVGGTSAILKYTANFTDNFSMSAMWGQAEFNNSESSNLDNNPVIYYTEDGANFIQQGDWAVYQPGTSKDKRTAYRLDFDWFLGNHRLRFGLDSEINKSKEQRNLSGGIDYDIYNYAVDPYVTVYHEYISGNFKTTASAFYIEDTFSYGNTTTTFGLRNEKFENLNGSGGKFLDMDQQWAPRLGFAWDIGGNGSKKLYANLGRYYLPVANILNIRLAGAFYADNENFEYLGQNPDGTPILGDSSGLFIQFDGQEADPNTIVNQNIKPMYQDEMILGYTFKINNLWTADINAVYRDMGRAIEDSAPCQGLDKTAYDQYGIEDYCFNISTPYVLTNPGSGMVFWHDFGQGDGLQKLEYSAAELGFPKAKRTYEALNISVARAYEDNWSIAASYTYSRNKGNYEGTVRSDYASVESNAGFTTAFDFYSMLEYGSGYLPNDRANVFKVWGNWGFVKNWNLGWNFYTASGRPISYFGVHPTDENVWIYGGSTFYKDGEPAPRGSFGRTPWINSLDLSMQYDLSYKSTITTFRVEVFNVFNSGSSVSVYEEGELAEVDYDNVSVTVTPDINYGVPYEFQAPRSVLFTAEITF